MIIERQSLPGAVVRRRFTLVEVGVCARLQDVVLSRVARLSGGLEAVSSRVPTAASSPAGGRALMGVRVFP
jgi:hypothetical protein